MKKRGAEGSALSLCKGCSDPFPEQLQKEKVRRIEKVKEIFSAAPPAFAAVEQQERCAQQHPREAMSSGSSPASRHTPASAADRKRGGERAEKTYSLRTANAAAPKTRQVRTYSAIRFPRSAASDSMRASTNSSRQESKSVKSTF